MTINFNERVAIVTGGGNGLGREHCIALAARGAKVVVNDFGSAMDGSRNVTSPAMEVVEEIISAGGEAIANDADVTQPAQVQDMVDTVKTKWGRVDVLVNNAGILRDKSFAKINAEDFKRVVDVHLFGAMNCTKAVWGIMQRQNYGRIVMTSSSSGIYGNFGQSNYGAAKAGLIGLMNVLHLEGMKYDIRVNALAPTAATRMLEGLLPDDLSDMMHPRLVSPGLLYLVCENAPTRTILGAGAGCFAVSRIYETKGAFLGPNVTVDDVETHWGRISDADGQTMLENGGQQTDKFVKAAASLPNTANFGAQ